ncbi:hypothetical protein ACFY36_36450 [Actinoplanes sp. NPDC000266]
MTRRRLWASMTIVGCVLLLGGWIAFLARNGLDRADQLSSVVGAIIAAALGVAGLWAALRPASGQDAGQVQINQASGNATMYNVQDGDLHTGAPARPDET